MNIINIFGWFGAITFIGMWICMDFYESTEGVFTNDVAEFLSVPFAIMLMVFYGISVLFAIFYED